MHVAQHFHAAREWLRKRKLLSMSAGIIIAVNLLYLWLPFRVVVVKALLLMGGDRLFIGAEYSPLDSPRFAPAAQTDAYPPSAEVIALEVNGVAQAIPVSRLAWHLVLNEEISGEPVVVTLCTFTGAAMAFKARLGERILHFRPIGLARNNLVMRDHETASRWQQFTGAAIAGMMAGSMLSRIPVERMPLEAWRQRHPNGQVLEPLRSSKDMSAPHDSCPVMCHFPSEDFLLQRPGNEDGRLPRKQIVLGSVQADGSSLASPENSDQGFVSPSQVRCYWFAWAEFHPRSKLLVLPEEKLQSSALLDLGGTP